MNADGLAALILAFLAGLLSGGGCGWVRWTWQVLLVAQGSLNDDASDWNFQGRTLMIPKQRREKQVEIVALLAVAVGCFALAELPVVLRHYMGVTALFQWNVWEETSGAFSTALLMWFLAAQAIKPEPSWEKEVEDLELVERREMKALREGARGTPQWHEEFSRLERHRWSRERKEYRMLLGALSALAFWYFLMAIGPVCGPVADEFYEERGPLGRE